jgi:hypothetical protein
LLGDRGHMSEFERPVELLRQTYDAFNQRDIDTVLAMLDGPVDAHVEPVELVADGHALIVDVHEVGLKKT